MTGRPRNKPRNPIETRLRKLMAAAGIRYYTELADKAGLHPSAVQYLAAGKRSPTVDTLKKLSNALDCEITELIL